LAEVLPTTTSAKGHFLLQFDGNSAMAARATKTGLYIKAS
jgi:hypothetical protein